MKTFDGYKKRNLTDKDYALLAGGGHKALDTLFSALSSDTTNAIKITVGGTEKSIPTSTLKTSLGLGSNAYTSTAYLPLAGGTMTGLLTTTSGNSHKGIKVGNTYINAINGDLIFQNNSAIRFGGDSWDYNVWAGLKYVHSSKTIYLGLADGSAFTANSAQSGGKLYLPGIANIYTGNGTNLVWHAGNDGSGSGLDADLLDGIHANGLFTAFSNAGSQTTRITIGGVTKDLKIDADTVDGIHASSFYKNKTLRSNQDSIYDLRWNYGKYDKGDFLGTYKGEYPTNYGAYLSLTYNDKNIGALMFFDAPTSNVLGHVYVRTRGAGDNNTTYSEWGTLAYLTDNVASATKWKNARTLTLTGSVTGNVSIDGSLNVTLTTTTNHSHAFEAITSKPTTVAGYGITDIRPYIAYNFTNGCFIKTSVTGTYTFVRLCVYGTTNSGNASKKFKPIFTIIDCYNYNSNIIELNATHFGFDFGQISAFIYDRALCFWFKQPSLYQAFNIYAYVTSGNFYEYNVVTSVTNSAIPSSGISNLVTVTPTKIVYAFGTASDFIKGDGSLDSNSYALASSLNNYLSLSGGVMTGTINCELLANSRSAIKFRGGGTWDSGIAYDSYGNESLFLWAKQPITRLRWHAGIDFSTFSNGSMMGITPDFEISKATGTATGYIGGNTILHSTNYNSYAPKLDGTGASGTWSISITGNAATAPWSGITGKPNIIIAGNAVSVDAGMISALDLNYSLNQAWTGGFGAYGGSGRWFCIGEITLTNSDNFNATFMITGTHAYHAEYGIFRISCRLYSSNPSIAHFDSLINNGLDLTKLYTTWVASGSKIVVKLWNYSSGWSAYEAKLLSYSAWGSAKTYGLAFHTAHNTTSGYSSPLGNIFAGGNPTNCNIYAANFYSSSDIRLKNNINNISKSIRSFNWNDTGLKSYGLIAQEIEDEYPELVSNNDNGYKSINYTSALCMIIARLENELDELRKRINLLQTPPLHLIRKLHKAEALLNRLYKLTSNKLAA